jgi:hypothetical protein
LRIRATKRCERPPASPGNPHAGDFDPAPRFPGFSSLASTNATDSMGVLLCLGLLDLARGDLGDHDGCADHVGGALLTSGASGHAESI